MRAFIANIIMYCVIEPSFSYILRNTIFHWQETSGWCGAYRATISRKLALRKLCVLERAAPVQRTRFRSVAHLKVKFPPWEFNIARRLVVLVEGAFARTRLRLHPRVCVHVLHSDASAVAVARPFASARFHQSRLDMQIIRRKNRPGMRQRRYN